MRQSRRWLRVSSGIVIAAPAIALFVALGTISDSVFVREPFSGAEHADILARTDRSDATAFFITADEAQAAASRLGVPAVSYGTPAHEERDREAILYTRVSPSFFQTLGVSLQRGAGVAVAGNGAVISDRLWRSRFRAADDALGQTILIERQPVVVVGVAPRNFGVPMGTDVWLPIRSISSASRFQWVIRRPEGMSRDDVNRRLQGIRAVAIREYLWPKQRWELLLLTAINSLLLAALWLHFLFATLADSVARIQEFRVRLALGASLSAVWFEAWRKAFTIVAYSTLAGAVLSPIALRLLLSHIPEASLAGHPVDLSLRALLLLGLVFAVGALGVTAALVPAFRSVRASPRPASTSGVVRLGWGVPLIVAMQVGIAFATVYLSGLSAISFNRLQSVELGYRPESVLATLNPEPAPLRVGMTLTADKRAAWAARTQALLTEIAGIPGVAAVATSQDRPGRSPGFFGQGVWLPERGPQFAVPSETATIGGDYFNTLRIPLLAGKAFDDRIGMRSPTRGWDEMIIDRTLMTALGTDFSIVGRELSIGGFPTRVIGIVEAIHPRSPDERLNPRYYLRASVASPTAPVILTRITGRIDEIPREIDAIVRRASGAELPRGVWLTDELDRLRAPFRGRLGILSVAGVFATLLTIAGMLGACRYAIARRERSLAIRAAIGATQAQLVWAALKHLFLSSIVGLIAGGALGATIGMQLQDVMYSTTVVPLRVVLVMTGGTILVVAMGALGPVRRLWSLDIVRSLKAH